MKPRRYQSLNAQPGVTYYATGPDFIAVQFQGPTVYIYDHTRPGQAHVARMKELALSGRGLSGYISQNVQDDYARKQDSW